MKVRLNIHRVCAAIRAHANPADTLKAFPAILKGALTMDPLTTINTIFTFLNTPVGQKIADALFTDVQAIKADIAGLIHHVHEKVNPAPAK